MKNFKQQYEKYSSSGGQFHLQRGLHLGRRDDSLRGLARLHAVAQENPRGQAEDNLPRPWTCH